MWQGWRLLPSYPTDHILVKIWFWAKGCRKHLNPNSSWRWLVLLEARKVLALGPPAAWLPGPGRQPPSACRSSAALLIHPARFPRRAHHIPLHMASSATRLGSGCSRAVTGLSVRASSLPALPFIKQELFFHPPGFIPPLFLHLPRNLVFLILTVDFFYNSSGL